MARNNIKVINISGGVREYEVASGATAILPGEPLMFTPTYTSGVSDVNTAIVLTDTKPVIGTDSFLGIASSAGTHSSSVAGVVNCIIPIPFATLIRGAATSATAVDTASELTGFLFDLVVFDLTSSVYTIDQAGDADTGGLRIEDGNPSKSTLDVSVDARAMRSDVA